MNIQDKIKSNPVVVFLGALLAGFVAGITTYQSILEIADLEIARKNMSCDDERVTFRIITEPSDSKIEIDDGSLKFYQLMCIKPGRYLVKVSANNYIPEERVVQINKADHVAIVNLKRENRPMSVLMKNKKYTGEKLSINFQDIPIRAVLQLMADFTGINIIVSDAVHGNLTLRLNNVPWDAALDTIIATKGLKKQQSGNILLISDR